ncbi:MAG: sulfotransferase domain-containing protein [Nitrospirales bacterium]
MANAHHPIPSFILIGAQKAGTTWLWNNLKQHPDVALPKAKEIHFFGGSEMFRKGTDWYYKHFDGLDPSKVTGEASTTYLYDYVPFWESPSGELKHDDSLPCIPELVTKELPDVKILVILRNPVTRAVSAYRHHVRAGRVPAGFGLRETAQQVPMLRILEMGYYARYLEVWKQYVPADRMRVFIFEEDVVKSPENSIRQICEFLGINPTFHPKKAEGRVHEGWSWTRCAINQSNTPLARTIARGWMGDIFDRNDFLKNGKAMKEDMHYLQSVYQKEKQALEQILARNLNIWKY